MPMKLEVYTASVHYLCQDLSVVNTYKIWYNNKHNLFFENKKNYIRGGCTPLTRGNFSTLELPKYMGYRYLRAKGCIYLKYGG